MIVKKTADALKLHTGIEQLPGDQLHRPLAARSLHNGIDGPSVVKHQAVALDFVQVASVFGENPVKSRVEAVKNGLILGRTQELREKRVLRDIEETDTNEGFLGLRKNTAGFNDGVNQLTRKVEILDLPAQIKLIADPLIQGYLIHLS